MTFPNIGSPDETNSGPPAIDPDPDVELRGSPGDGDIAPVLPHHLKDAQTRPGGTLKIVLMGRRDAEVCADPIPLVGLHSAAVLAAPLLIWFTHSPTSIFTSSAASRSPRPVEPTPGSSPRSGSWRCLFGLHHPRRSSRLSEGERDPEVLRLGIQLSDGRKATTLNQGYPFQAMEVGPERPTIDPIGYWTSRELDESSITSDYWSFQPAVLAVSAGATCWTGPCS